MAKTKILIVEFKKKKHPEAYNTLPAFLENYPSYAKERIEHCLSRLKRPFEDKVLKITRVELVKKDRT